MDEAKTTQTTTPAGDDILVPDGWTEGDDIFAPETWKGSGEANKAEPVESKPDVQDSSATEQSEANAETDTETEPPTTEQTDEAAEESEGSPEEPPTTEPKGQEPKRLKIKAKVNHEEQEVEIDEADLPTIYQRSVVTEKLQSQLASVNPLLTKVQELTKAMGYDNPDAMLEGAIDNLRKNKLAELAEQGVPDEIAQDYVTRTIGAPAPTSPSAPPPPPGSVLPEGQPQGRNYREEVTTLLAVRPELRDKKIPDEVVNTAIKQNIPLVAAYLTYEESSKKAETEALRRENQRLKQNAAAAAKAPVKGVSKGGPTDNTPDDPFLAGFRSDG